MSYWGCGPKDNSREEWIYVDPIEKQRKEADELMKKYNLKPINSTGE